MATIQYVVNAVDGASATFARIAGSADNLLHQLDDIGKKSATARVGLDGDKAMGLTLDKLDLKMANLAKRVATGKVGVEGQARAMLQIRAMELELDKLGAKDVTATVHVNVDRRGLGRLFGGGAGGGGLLGLLGSVAGGGASAAGSAVGALGGGGGDITQAIKGGAIGAAALGAAALAPAAIPTLLGGGIGGLGLVLTQAKGLQTVLADIIKTLKTAAAPLKGAFGDILKNFDQFIKSQGPGLREMFKASLPFLNVFVKALEQLGKTLLPVVTASLRQMRPYLPLISQGFVAVIQGLADMIKAIGPRGMQASAMLFVDLCRAMGFALTVLGKLVNGLAVTVQYTVHAIHTEWRDLQHLTSDAFDQIRHYIAASWNATWRDTVTKAQNGIATVVGFFRGLTSRALAAMFGFGHSLAAFMRSAFTDMWNAAKNVAGSIWHWLTGWVHDLPGWLRKLLHISSPSGVFYDIGKQMMMGLFHGIQDHARQARSAAQSAVGGIGAPGALGGPTSAGARAAMEYARSRLSAYGWGPSQMSPLINLWNQESGWNRLARNASSGAYGIPQALPPGKMGAAANPPLSSAAAQINWGLGYIKTRPGYGSPAAAWAHEQAFNWYDRGGFLPVGASLAMNNTGQPEQVLGPGSLAETNALLRQAIALLRIAPAATSAGTAQALNSAARGALR